MKISVDGKEYDLLVTSIKRKATIKDGKNTTSTLSGIYKRDVVGTYYDYMLDVSRKDSAQYDAFYEVITAPQNEPHTVTLPYGQKTMTFKAYIQTSDDELKAQTPTESRWGELSVNFKAVEPQRRLI